MKKEFKSMEESVVRETVYDLDFPFLREREREREERVEQSNKKNHVITSS